MKIKKYSGELVDFEEDKLRQSLSKSGASSQTVDVIVQAIRPQLFDGIHTREVYRMAFNHLKRRSNSFAARYSLKRALRDLGPDGYFFEQWAARLFEYLGYQTATSQHLPGHAVSHEVDIVGLQDKKLLIAECKFRNSTEAKISVTTPMYFLSRFKDLEGKQFTYFKQPSVVAAGWLVTNAYLTTDAIAFSEYYRINVLSWDYPRGKNIKNRVDHMGLYPLTCLTSLKKSEKKALLSGGCILVKELLEKPQLMDLLTLSPTRRRNILEEAHALVVHQQETVGQEG